MRKIGYGGKMSLPIITTSEDVLDIINYLKTKPIGVSLDDARAAIDTRLLDPRKLSAYKYWGFLEKESERLMLSDLGWEIARRPEKKTEKFREVIKQIKPYFSVLEWVYYQKLDALSVVDVVLHWNRNFKEEVETNESANDQAACMFRLCEGAELGVMRIGRRGNPTRLELQLDALSEYITGQEAQPEIKDHQITEKPKNEYREDKPPLSEELQAKPVEPDSIKPSNTGGINSSFYKRVYISHGKNRSFVDPIKKLLTFGDFEAVVSIQEPSVSKPVPDKVMDDMRSCGAAIIHVDSEDILIDGSGKEHVIINQNVLIEIGAAMALYGKRYILLVKDGTQLPSNLQGLYEVRYKGDVLDGETTIKLLETINRLKQEKIPE